MNDKDRIVEEIGRVASDGQQNAAHLGIALIHSTPVCDDATQVGERVGEHLL